MSTTPPLPSRWRFSKIKRASGPFLRRRRGWVAWSVAGCMERVGHRLPHWTASRAFAAWELMDA
eukprot:7387352-Prymnesium_polylepis.1